MGYMQESIAALGEEFKTLTPEEQTERLIETQEIIAERRAKVSFEQDLWRMLPAAFFGTVAAGVAGLFGAGAGAGTGAAAGTGYVATGGVDIAAAAMEPIVSTAVPSVAGGTLSGLGGLWSGITSAFEPVLGALGTITSIMGAQEENVSDESIAPEMGTAVQPLGKPLGQTLWQQPGQTISQPQIVDETVLPKVILFVAVGVGVLLIASRILKK